MLTNKNRENITEDDAIEMLFAGERVYDRLDDGTVYVLEVAESLAGWYELRQGHEEGGAFVVSQITARRGQRNIEEEVRMFIGEDWADQEAVPQQVSDAPTRPETFDFQSIDSAVSFSHSKVRAYAQWGLEPWQQVLAYLRVAWLCVFDAARSLIKLPKWALAEVLIRMARKN